MDHSMITRLEDLPVEILIEIFDYFAADEIYLSFSQLNSRLNSIIKFISNVILVSKKHVDPSILSFFHSFKAIHIDFDYSRLGDTYVPYFINGSHRLFQIYPLFDWGWCSDPLNGIENIIHPDICSRLQSLLLPVTSSILVQSIFSGEFPRLERCHLGICKPIGLLLSTTIQVRSIRQLTIRQQKGCDLEKILSICPFLIYLDFSCVDGVLSPFIFTKSCFSSMKYLRLSRFKHFSFHNGQFDFLLSLFPDLVQFHLIVDQCHSPNGTIQFEKVAECLRHRLPRLKILNLRIYITKNMRHSLFRSGFEVVAQMHSLFKYVNLYSSLLMITSYGYDPPYYYFHRSACPSSE